MCDAPAWCVWGKTLREEDPHNEGTVEVTLRTTTHEVTRTSEKRDKLTWNRVGEEAPHFTSTTIATAELQKELNDMQTWARTHVFTSDDIGYFLMSTDAERKKFLEQLMGLDQYNEVHNKSKAALTDAKSKLDEVESEASNLRGQFEAYTASSVDDQDPPEKPNLARITALKEAARAPFEDQGLTKQVNKLETLTEQKREWLSDLEDGECPTCKQSIPETLLAETKAELKKLKKELSQLTAQQDELKQEWKKRRDEAAAELREEEEGVARFKAHHEQQQRAARLAAKAEEAKKKLSVCEQKATQLMTEVEHLSDCVSATSTRGVRAWVVSQALSTIAAKSNEYLGILGSKIRVELTGAVELKNGSTKDEIGLKLSRAGGGKFKGASQGERQRVALCVRLAIAEVNGDGGTIILDEPFSNIDDEGVDGAVELVKHLAETRCVVVITHNQRLTKSLGGKHLHLS